MNAKAAEAAAKLKSQIDYGQVAYHCTAALQALNEIAASATPVETAKALILKHGRNPYDHWTDMSNTVVRNEINALLS